MYLWCSGGLTEVGCLELLRHVCHMASLFTWHVEHVTNRMLEPMACAMQVGKSLCGLHVQATCTQRLSRPRNLPQHQFTISKPCTQSNLGRSESHQATKEPHLTTPAQGKKLCSSPSTSEAERETPSSSTGSSLTTFLALPGVLVFFVGDSPSTVLAAARFFAGVALGVCTSGVPSTETSPARAVIFF